MKTVWSKETRDSENEYYRQGAWGIEVDDDFSKNNFTEVKPDDYCLEQNCPADWNSETSAWDLDLTFLRTLLKEVIDAECWYQIAEQVYSYARTKLNIKEYLYAKQNSDTDNLNELRQITSPSQVELDKIAAIVAKITFRNSLVDICNIQTASLTIMTQAQLLAYDIDAINWTVE